MSDAVGLVLISIVIFAIMIIWVVVVLIRAINVSGDPARVPSMIQDWAKANGVKVRVSELKSSGYREQHQNAGPFTGLSDGVVFRVVVTKIGEEGRRAAWIRVGDDFKAIWEDEWRPQEPPVM